MKSIILIVDWKLVSVYMFEILNSLPFVALVVLILVDILTGKFKAIKHRIVDSTIGTDGIIKHTTIIILTLIVLLTVQLLDIGEVGYVFIMFYILEYVTSIMENLDALDIPLPDNFRKYFNRMKIENENERIGDDDV